MFSSPCVGILFSRVGDSLNNLDIIGLFSSPCVGILFSLNQYKTQGILKRLFSSPCVGILFSQQAWETPPYGLSIALLRRGFPID